jgi:polyisoprenoid-binding protein YceI
MPKKIMLFTLIFLGVTAPAFAQTPQAIDPDRSVANVKVYKAGLLSGFGHDHEIQGPIEQGAVDEEKGTVELVIDARKLKVVDQDLSDKDRSEVQQTMEGQKVLDVEHCPQIRFRSTSAKPAGQNKWIVQGELEIHGQTRPVTLQVERYAGLASSAARYRGSIELRQTDFGIHPFSSIGGAIKIKDKILVGYDVAVQTMPGSAAEKSSKLRN